MELVHPDDQEWVRRTLEDCLKGRSEEWDCEHRFRTDSGDWLWVQNQGLVTKRAPDGSPLEMMGITRNIDSYKRALVESQNKEAILLAADEISKVGVWEYDPETDQVFWSDLIRTILEVEDDFVLSPENTYKLVHPNDRKRLVKAFEKINKDGTSYDLRLRFISAEGREMLCRSAGRARYDENGKIVRIIGIFQDITELTTLQRELEAFFELSPDFQATLSLDGRFKFWSPSWEQQLGYSAQELASMQVSDLVSEVDRDTFCQLFAAAAAGASVDNYECRVLPKSDGQRACGSSTPWISWSFSVEPEIATVFVTARCVTAERESREALQEARIRAEEANRAKMNFLAVMSHELRTPLNPILGFAEMMLEDATSEDQREMLTAITESASQMLVLVSEILEYSKLDAGKTEVEPVAFSLEEFVQNKVHLMSGQIRGKPIQLSSSIHWGPVDVARLPVLTGDLGMLRQVCRNLVGNAIKFTKQGKVELNVSVLELQGEQVRIRFDVKDTGIGIAQEDMDKLFKPFSQVQTGSTRAYEGTGLGLAICNRLIELMDGHISVESQEGKGSTFSFTLPFKLSYSKQETADAEIAGTVSAKSKRKKLSGAILLVEDNQSNVRYTKRLADSWAINLEAVADGESALEQLQERRFDLVLLDLHMPGIGGLETLKRIRSSEKKSTREVPVYILTADASVKAKYNCEQCGADGVVVKPASPLDLYQVFTQYLQEIPSPI